MDLEIEAPIDDLEAVFAEEDDDTVLGDAAPTAECTQQGPTCS